MYVTYVFNCSVLKGSLLHDFSTSGIPSIDITLLITGVTVLAEVDLTIWKTGYLEYSLMINIKYSTISSDQHKPVFS